LCGEAAEASELTLIIRTRSNEGRASLAYSIQGETEQTALSNEYDSTQLILQNNQAQPFTINSSNTQLSGNAVLSEAKALINNGPFPDATGSYSTALTLP